MVDPYNSTETESVHLSQLHKLKYRKKGKNLDIVDGGMGCKLEDAVFIGEKNLRDLLRRQIRELKRVERSFNYHIVKPEPSQNLNAIQIWIGRNSDWVIESAV